MVNELVKNLEGQIMLKDFKLNSLLDITRAINTNKEVSELTRLFETPDHFPKTKWKKPVLRSNR